METNKGSEFLLVLGSISMGFFLGFWLGWKVIENKYHREAINNGAAEWVVGDAVTGKVEFKWKGK